MFVLTFDFGARPCYSTTWYSWRHRFHFCPDSTVHTSTKDIRIPFHPLLRAFPNLYGFGGSDPRVSVDGRPKRIKKYTDSNESALMWTGPQSQSMWVMWALHCQPCPPTLERRLWIFLFVYFISNVRYTMIPDCCSLFTYVSVYNGYRVRAGSCGNSQVGTLCVEKTESKNRLLS